MTDPNLADELANWVLRINKLCNEKDAEIERLTKIKIAADKAYRYHMLGYKDPEEFNANVMLDLMNELGALL